MPLTPLDQRVDGFRLQRFEVRNWGTFDEHVWRIAPGGENALLTGDIGSGKSTLVDGLTTLLVPRPANQIVFNKAAGSEARERSLSSYVKGEYKSEKDELTSGAKAISLRDESSYSVLLARFENSTLEQAATIAQLLYFKDKGGPVERLFVVSEQTLSIREHFSQFDSVARLKKQLRASGCRVSSGLKEYAGQMRRALGIESDRALDLFYQTVSMKAVDNLTQFVRRHMLDQGDSRERVEILCRSFEDLDRAHAAVVQARRQIERLGPLVEGGDRLLDLEGDLAAKRSSRDLLEPWRAERELALEQAREESLHADLSRVALRMQKLEEEIQHLNERERSIQSSLDDHGGSRLREIAQELLRLADELQRRKQYAVEYRRLCKMLELDPPDSADGFSANAGRITQLDEELRDRIGRLDDRRSELLADERQQGGQITELTKEIVEMENRMGNIPANNIIIRRVLCEALDLDESQLPFAGELIRVADSASQWEGAIERVLRNFGMSLLVPEPLYARVAEHIDRTNLRGRLVYYRITAPSAAADPRRLAPQSLVRKLELKADCFCYDWLLDRLARRFDYRCCENLTEFKRSSHAITLNGQLKGAGERHEKDDRHALHDRKRYVLGWDNRDKRLALTNQRNELTAELHGLRDQRKRISEEHAGLGRQLQALTALQIIPSFSEIDWPGSAKQINSLEAEQRQIEQTSDVLRELQQKLDQVRLVRNDKETRLRTAVGRHADVNADLRQCRTHQAETREILKETEASRDASLLEGLDTLYREHFDTPLDLRNIKARERELRTLLQKLINTIDAKRDRLRSQVEKAMSDYRHNYPAETQETDSSMDALDDYRRMLSDLTQDDLPRFERKFKQELNEKTIQSLLHFSSQLSRAENELRAKIARINASLTKIDYNDGSFIQLRAEPINDAEIRQFRQDLRGCLSEALGEGLYDESRFLQVKSIIERFRGREGHTDADRRWTLKVTDVRNWFTFSAEELWREDGERRDYFESSSGKSGGQKEKLAYTVLASALAYQFGLDQPGNLRAYRFVVIDEAFGRGSETSTRYALELFKQLGLQLLVVTPLQKIHVIEPYIRHVHFVHNEDNKNSQLRNMTIEEYREERLRRDQRELESAVASLTH